MCRRQILRFALFAVALATALVAGACAKKKVTTLYLPAEGTSIAITLDFPLNTTDGTKQDFSYLCQDAKSLLVSVDVGSSAAPSWSYRLLFDLGGQLWGCGTSSPCSRQEIAKALPKPSRIAVEALDVSASDYFVSGTHNVICRGVADVTVGMGTIDAQAAATPSPGPTPQGPIQDLSVSAVVPMLRVGDVNGTFTSAGASEALVTGGSLWPEEWRATRSTTGGVVAFTEYAAQGANRVLQFLPWKIGAFPTTASLTHRRVGASALAFVTSSGAPALFIYGGNFNLTSIDEPEIYYAGSSTTRTLGSLGTLRGSKAVSLPDHLEGGVITPVIAVVGGIAGDTGAYTFNPLYEYFFPSAPIDLSGCPSGSVTGSPAFCRPGAGYAEGDGGHAGGPVGVAATPGGLRVFIGPGYSGVNATISNHAYAFDPSSKTYAGPLVLVGNVSTMPMVSASSVALSTDLLGVFGGSNLSGNPATSWAYFRGSDSSYVGASSSSPSMIHFGNGQVKLLDGRVALIAGGTNPPDDARTVEFFVPSAGSPTSGGFAYSSRSRNQAPCTASTDPNCVRLEVTRSAAVVEALAGSRTWINGAIVVTGGAPSPIHGTELFVPAYECAGSVPVRYGTSLPIDGADFCDIGRNALPVTDPEAPTPLSP